MRNDQVTGASTPIEIEGKAFEAYPLSDKELESLTQWARYKMLKNGLLQAEFAETAAEAEDIKQIAFKNSLTVQWFDEIGINLLLNDTDGLVEVAFRMFNKEWKKDWFRNKFGKPTEYTDQQLQNRQSVQQAFLKQNTLETSEEKGDDKSTVKKKKVTTKKSST